MLLDLSFLVVVAFSKSLRWLRQKWAIQGMKSMWLTA